MSEYKVYVTSKNSDDRLKEYDLEKLIIKVKIKYILILTKGIKKF